MIDFIKTAIEIFIIVFISMFVFMYGLGLLVIVIKNIVKYKHKFFKYVYNELRGSFFEDMKVLLGYSGIATGVFIIVIFILQLFKG